MRKAELNMNLGSDEVELTIRVKCCEAQVEALREAVVASLIKTGAKTKKKCGCGS